MGIKNLIQYQKLARNQIIILPGGGIKPENIEIFSKHGFPEIHTSASRLIKENPRPKISMNSEKFFNETQQYESDFETIQKLIKNTNI